MHTKAVFRAAQALSEVGFHVLRFNFRGVGTSTGSYGDGVDEREDVVAALDFMAEREPELPLLVGGFSFGARVGLQVGVEDERVRGLIGMGLPLSMAEFTFLQGVERPVLVVQGEEDEFGDGETVAKVVEELDGAITLVRIPGSDHYFHDRFEELQDALREYFTDGAGGESFPVGTTSEGPDAHS
jgi:uncharacterized protein